MFTGNFWPYLNTSKTTSTSASFTVSRPESDGNDPNLRYKLTCKPEAAYSFAQSVTESNTALSVTITGLHPGAKYACYYQAVNTIGASNPSLSVALRLNDDGRYM